MGCLVVYLAYSFFGGAMLVNFELFLSLNGLCELCALCSMLLCFYHSLPVLFLKIGSFSCVYVLYGNHMNIVEDTTLIMGSIHLQFFHTFHYSPLSSLVGVNNVVSHLSFPPFNSIYLPIFILLLSSFCFPFDLVISLILSKFVFLSVCVVSYFKTFPLLVLFEIWCSFF
jgi:hypothetical protein